MAVARRDRSRSPHASNGSSFSHVVPGGAWPPAGCSFQNKTLVLNNVQIPFIHLKKQGQDEIWMPAKSVMKTTGETTITHIMERVFEDDKMTFEKFVNSKGLPLEGCCGFATPPNPEDHNEKKAIWVNESGFYAMVLGSRKPHCVAFQRWVLHDVLPSIRRQGSYGGGSGGSAELRLWFDEDLKVVLKKRDDEWRIASRQRDDEWQLAQRGRDDSLQLALRQRDDAVQLAISAVTAAVTSGLDARLVHLEEALCRRDESHATRFSAQLEAARVSLSELLASKFSSLILSLADHINSSVTAAVAAGLGLKKAQPKKKTTSAAEMPEDQRATPLQTGPLSLGLSTVALTMFPELPFAVWRKIRGSFGHYAKKERLRLHALGERHPQYVAMPLLWAYTGSCGTVEGGGVRYVYLSEHSALLQRVFRAQLQTSRSQRNSGAPAPTESLEQRAHRLAAQLSPAERGVQWPIHVAELEPQWNEGEDGV